MEVIKKYKLYHIPFWGLYHFIWWSIYDGDPLNVARSIFSTPSMVKYLFYVVFQALGVYFCLYFLMPRYLEKAKYLQFLSYLAIVIGIVAFCAIGGYYCSAYFADKDPYVMYKISPRTPLSFFKYNTLSSTISVFTLAMSIKLTKNWVIAQQQRQLLEKEKLETELKFLKSQFNPHFLFNTINSVFFLIDNNPVMASETLAKFSDLLRYQLYDCNETTIPLARELKYIQSFIELEEIRLDKNYVISLCIDDENSGGLKISPFLIMPFVENAFKHISHYQEKENWINISIETVDETLTLKISNSTSKVHTARKRVEEYSGIGLQNVKRRLELLYPNKFSLQIHDDTTAFSAELSLQLENMMASNISIV